MNKILQTIKEGEKEFDKKIGKLPNGNDFLVEKVRTKDNFCISCGHPANPNKTIENIKSHIASQNKKLLEVVVKEIGMMKERTILEQERGGEYPAHYFTIKQRKEKEDMILGYNQAFSNIKQLLTDTIKEL